MTLEPVTVTETVGANPELQDMTRRLMFGGLLTAPVFVLEMAGHLRVLNLHHYVSMAVSMWVQFALATGTGTDVAMQSAGITLVKGDLAGIARGRALSRATMRNIRENLLLAFVYNVLGVPVAAGVLYPAYGVLLSPVMAAAAMSLSSVSVIGNALRLKAAKI
jgi:cation transport ATPase